MAPFLLLQAKNQEHLSKKPYIVTTTAQIADIVENIGGNHWYVEHLMGTGVDPHLYRPTRSDVAKLGRADLIIYNGLQLEGQMLGLFHTLSSEKPVIGLADGIPKSSLLTDFEKTYDPHIWMSVPLWQEGVKHVSRTLIKFDPEHRESYMKDTAAYLEKLDLLHEYIQTSIKSIPEDKRLMITAHDAFGYFGHTYGIEVRGIQGLSTESESGLKHIEQLVSLLVEKDIPAVFSETSVNDRNIQAVIAGAKRQNHPVTLGGALYSDAMGPEDTYEGTYIGMIEHNTRLLTDSLGGVSFAFAGENSLAMADTPY